MDRIRVVSRNLVWGVFSKCVALLFPFITRTVMIYTMGLPYLGLSGLFSSVLMILNLAELGIGSALVFSMYKPMADRDDGKICALLAYYRRCYRVIGTVILLLGLGMFPFIRFLVRGDVPSDIRLETLFAVYLLNDVLGYYLFAYKQSIFIAAQRSDYLSKVSTVLQCVSEGCKIAALLLTRNYYAYILILPLSTCANNIVIGLLTGRLYPQYRCEGELDARERKELRKKVSGLVLQKIGGIVNNAVDSIVISAFLGLVTLAMYQNYYVIISALMGIIWTINASLTATVGNCVASESVEKNHALFTNLNFIYIWIVGWCGICLSCLYQPFIGLWLGRQYLFSYGMVLLFAVYFLANKWCDILGIFQEACGLWWETRFIPLAGAALNLLANIALVKTIGLPGILISTIVSILLVYNVGCARVLFRTYFRPIRGGLGRFWKQQLIFLLEIVVCGVITWAVCSCARFRSDLWQLIFNAAVCVVIPNALFLLIWRRRPETAYAKRTIAGVFRLR